MYDPNKRNVLLDEYLTPVALIEACFEQAILPLLNDHSYPVMLVDICANDGRWGKIARKYLPNSFITGLEIMDMPKPDGFDLWVVGNALEYKPVTPYDMVIGNPAFTVKEPNGIDPKTGKQKYKIIYRAEDFVRKGLQLVRDGGIVVNLLRSNFRHSVGRYWSDKGRTKPGLLQADPVCRVGDLTMRPSFYKGDKRTKQYGTNKTNAHDYALFIWSKGYVGDYSGFQIDWTYED